MQLERILFFLRLKRIRAQATRLVVGSTAVCEKQLSLISTFLFCLIARPALRLIPSASSSHKNNPLLWFWASKRGSDGAAGGGATPGDVVWGAGGEAGLQAVRAVHADGVRRRAVVRVRQGVQVDVGLGDDPAAELIPPLPLLAQVGVAVARWREDNRQKLRSLRLLTDYLE